MKTNKLLVALVGVSAIFCSTLRANAQDAGLTEPQFIAACEAILNADDEGLGHPYPAPVPNDDGPKGLTPFYIAKLMPSRLPEWGAYSKPYPLHGAKGWSRRHYHIGRGDIIIAVNDVRVRNMEDLELAMKHAGDAVVLTVVDPKEHNFIYCIGLEIYDRELPIDGFTNFKAKDWGTPRGVVVWRTYSDFNGHVYLRSYPRPWEID